MGMTNSGKAKEIQVFHGPNLNLLGTREPEVYGTTTLAEIDGALRAQGLDAGLEVKCFQTNREGELIDEVHACREHSDGILINPGGLTHTSVSLRDALLSVDIPFVEVHLSNVYARESFRRHSYLSDVAVGIVSGFGPASYRLGFDALVTHLDCSTV